jgi:hypothetical protein
VLTVGALSNSFVTAVASQMALLRCPLLKSRAALIIYCIGSTCCDHAHHDAVNSNILVVKHTHTHKQVLLYANTLALGLVLGALSRLQLITHPPPPHLSLSVPAVSLCVCLAAPWLLNWLYQRTDSRPEGVGAVLFGLTGGTL